MGEKRKSGYHKRSLSLILSVMLLLSVITGIPSGIASDIWTAESGTTETTVEPSSETHLCETAIASDCLITVIETETPEAFQPSESRETDSGITDSKIHEAHIEPDSKDRSEPDDTPQATKTPEGTDTQTPANDADVQIPGQTVYANGISGLIWLDANGNGKPDKGEPAIAKYPVYLYKSGDIHHAVGKTTTDREGMYRFAHIEPGLYVVAVHAEEVNGKAYLPPDTGIRHDNRFAAASLTITSASLSAYTEPLHIGADTLMTDISAGIRADTAEIREETDETEETEAPETIDISEEAEGTEEEDIPEEAEEADASEEAGETEETDVPEENNVPDETEETDEAGETAETDVPEESNVPDETEGTEEAGETEETDIPEESNVPDETEETEEADETAETDVPEESSIPEETEETEEDDIPEVTEETEEETQALGSIAGFLWVDGSILPDGTNRPLPGYPVMLYTAVDLSAPILQTQSDENGMYLFNDLDDGDYVAALSRAAADDTEYMPMQTVSETNRFAYDEEDEPLTAYTEMLSITSGTIIEHIDGGLLPVYQAAPTDPGYMAVIDLSTTLTGGTGYTVAGVYVPFNPAILQTPTGSLTFTAGADGLTYQIIQTGIPNNVQNPAAPKQGSSIYSVINIDPGVHVTLIISDIDLSGVITLKGNASVHLLLDGTNYVRTCITTPSAAQITIDSLSGNHAADRLIIPSTAGTGYSAAIGGPANGDAGAINIAGGTIDITIRSVGAGIGGGGAASGAAGNGGAIMISGGIVNITQYGSGSLSGTGYSGAGIGGGGGSNSGFGGDAGSVVISGGTVTVRQHTRAAGIGGGTFGPAGNITITGGFVDVSVIRLDDLAGAGDGAAIGASAGTNRPGIGYVSISGGVVIAASQGAGAGIGISNSATPVHISITGGNIYARSVKGAGIGCFYEASGTTISITGGTVSAYSEQNAAIGSRLGYEPALHLGAGANVRAYSAGADPAINALNNTGDGYCVNASLQAPLMPLTDTVMKVFAADNRSIPVKSLTLPAGYRHFAYSSELDAPRTDSILTYDGPAVTGVILRAADDSPHIYSVIARNGYNAHNGGANYGALPVKLTSGVTADVRFGMIVTGSYADKTRPFVFTVTFTDDAGNPMMSGETLAYQGGAADGTDAAAPEDGLFTADENGQTVFSLRHGQMITMTDIPAGITIRIVQSGYQNYSVSFTDSEQADVPESGADTGERKLAEIYRSFMFVNEREAPPVTGIGGDNTGAFLPILLAVILISAAYTALKTLCRRKSFTVS